MKKQLNPACHTYTLLRQVNREAHKLSLNKRTISNLSNTELSHLIGGAKTNGKKCDGIIGICTVACTRECPGWSWSCAYC